LRLHKALYGLCQDPRAWNSKLNASLGDIGFTRCTAEHGLYTHVRNGSRVVIGVYVDDLLIVGESMKDIEQFKGEMKSLFRMNNLGTLSYYLVIEVRQGRHGIDCAKLHMPRSCLRRRG
jgi:hypothetical protein